MSMENINANAPERDSGENKEMFDAEGNKRMAYTFQDGEVFWGSEKEIKARTIEKREELHNK